MSTSDSKLYPENEDSDPLALPTFDFGNFPHTSYYRDSNSRTGARFPLNLTWDAELGVVKISEPFPIHAIEPKHSWLVCYEPESHLDELASSIAGTFGAGRVLSIGGFSFKDSSLLDRLLAHGHEVTPDVAQSGLKSASHAAFYATFGLSNPNFNFENQPRFDLFVVRHLLEHAYNLHDFISGTLSYLNEDGVLLFEVPDCSRAFASGECTVLWEEHIYYFTEESIATALQACGLRVKSVIRYANELEDSLVVFCQRNPTAGGSILSRAAHGDSGLSLLRDFHLKVRGRKALVRTALSRLRKECGPIAIFGAAHLAFTFVIINEVCDLIDCYIDDDPNKNLKFPPVGACKILPADANEVQELKTILLGTNPASHHKIKARISSFLPPSVLVFSIFSSSEDCIDNLF